MIMRQALRDTPTAGLMIMVKIMGSDRRPAALGAVEAADDYR